MKTRSTDVLKGSELIRTYLFRVHELHFGFLQIRIVFLRSLCLLTARINAILVLLKVQLQQLALLQERHMKRTAYLSISAFLDDFLQWLNGIFSLLSWLDYS